MKIVKMSLVAAMLVGASAYAIDNVKVSGNAQLMYGTVDGKTADLFDKDSSAADAAIYLNASADLVSGVSAGVAFTGVSTLGLENNFVSNVWAGSHGATAATGASFAGPLGGAKVEDASWFNEAWLAAKLGNTTAKVGRMELDTPLAFTETWSIERNSFEAAVAINQDVPDTTIVLAYVGNGNGNETFGQDRSGTVKSLGHTFGAVVNENGDFTTYGVDGAYAAGVINNSLEMLTVQGWYYDVSKFAQAYWIQADVAMSGAMLGAQYSGIDLDAKTGAKGTSSSVFAVMAGYEVKDMVTLKASFSSVDKDFGAGFNTATSTGQSKLYTEAWWNYGYVVRPDTTAITVTATGNVADMVDMGVYFTMADQSTDAGDGDMTEVTVTAGKSVGPLDVTLAYVFTDAKDQNGGDAYNGVQAYLKLNF
jgi:hypothetical protein